MTDQADLDAIELRGRLVIGITSLKMLVIIIWFSIHFKIHKAPSFVRTQLILLFLCNLGGLIMSCSMIKRNFFTSTYTFTWQGFWISMYYGANLLSGWCFAYRYLMTSRTL